MDCACHKGNRNCPVQKRNPVAADLTPTLPPALTIGAETRHRKARRRELELQGYVIDEGSTHQNDELAETPAAESATGDNEVKIALGGLGTDHTTTLWQQAYICDCQGHG